MNRRSMLATAAGGAASVLAGCSAVPGLNGSGGRGGSEGSWSSVGDWLAIGEVEGIPTDYDVDVVSPAEVAANEDLLSRPMREQLVQRSFERLGLEPADVDLDVSVGPSMDPFPSLYTVALGSFSRSEVVDALVAAGAEVDSEDGAYRILRWAGGEDAWYVVGDGAVLWLPRASGTKAAIEPILNTVRGDRSTFLETVEPARTVADRLPDGLSRILSTFPAADGHVDSHSIPGVVVDSDVTALGDGALEFTSCMYFVDEEHARSADIEGRYARFEDAPRYSEATIERDGQVVEATIARDLRG